MFKSNIILIRGFFLLDRIQIIVCNTVYYVWCSCCLWKSHVLSICLYGHTSNFLATRKPVIIANVYSAHGF
jgi:hypothetical protein